MTGAAFSTERLGRLYGRSWALSDCTISFPAGSVTGLVGTNGAGKTTLLRLVAGLIGPSMGAVLFDGERRQRGRPADLARVALLPQGAPLYGWMTVAETLRFGREMNPAWEPGCEARCREVFPLPLGLKVYSLSGGQRAQLALTLALAKAAGVVLLDEPLAELESGALIAMTVVCGATAFLAVEREQ